MFPKSNEKGPISRVSFENRVSCMKSDEKSIFLHRLFWNNTFSTIMWHKNLILSEMSDEVEKWIYLLNLMGKEHFAHDSQKKYLCNFMEKGTFLQIQLKKSLLLPKSGEKWTLQYTKFQKNIYVKILWKCSLFMYRKIFIYVCNFIEKHISSQSVEEFFFTKIW